MYVQNGFTGIPPTPTPHFYSKLIILVDMDGVMCDWFGSAMSYIQEVADGMKLGKLDLSLFTEWKVEKTLEKHYPALVEAFLSFTRSKGFYAGLKPIKGSIEAVKKLREEGHEVFFCSSPETESEGYSCHSEKAEWVAKHIGEDWLKKMILTNDKTLVRGDILIDDKKDITGVMEPVWEHIRFHSPVYQAEELVEDWETIPDEVSRISYQKICEEVIIQ